MGSINFTVQVSDGAQPTPQTSTKIFSLTVTATAPILNTLNPSSTIAGGPAFTLTVNGSNFVSNSAVRWNGVNRTTTFVSSSQLTAAIPATDIATVGTASITVLNPGPSTSNALTFTISGPGLTITTNSPLPQGVVGTSYSQTLAASGGTAPYAWSLTCGIPSSRADSEPFQRSHRRDAIGSRKFYFHGASRRQCVGQRDQTISAFNWFHRCSRPHDFWGFRRRRTCPATESRDNAIGPSSVTDLRPTDA